MHELAAVTNLLEIMEDEAAKRGFKKVTRISLVLGELSSILEEPFRTYFDIASAGGVCAGAELHFERRPAMLKCLACGVEFPHSDNFVCPVCGGDSTLSGDSWREFYIESFEGPDPDNKGTET